YDTTAKTVTVTVADKDGQLEASATSDAAMFTNTYEATSTKLAITATKELTGRELKDGEFEFVLKDSEGKEVGRATNKADGSITFDEIEFTKTGDYTYTIEEV
ncbi:TPA: cell surface protein, partial [Streptococcus suis]|nr:cell surface protein [Streptococcus suis]